MEDFLVGGGFFDDDDDGEAQQESLWNPPPPLQDVAAVLRLVGHKGDDDEEDEDCHVLSSVRLRAQTEFVQCHMGSLELCQGYRGDMLREIGAFNAVLDLLTAVKERQLITRCTSSSTTNSEQERDLLELCRVCWGAIRDMTCGVIGNRNAMRERILRTRCGDGKDTTETGLTLAVDYLHGYHGQCWEELEPSHLDLLTAVLGVLRNVSHKTPQNCAVLHNCGATTLLVWRMLHADRNGGGLSDATVPWREAVYRTLYTLINLAECHDPSVLECSRHPALVYQLLESWGSNKRLQPMFQNLVAHAKHELPDNDFDPLWNRFL